MGASPSLPSSPHPHLTEGWFDPSEMGKVEMVGKFPMQGFLLGARQTLVSWSLWWLLWNSPWECSSTHSLPWRMILSKAWLPILGPLLGRVWAAPMSTVSHVWPPSGHENYSAILDLSRPWVCQLKPIAIIFCLSTQATCQPITHLPGVLCPGQTLTAGPLRKLFGESMNGSSDGPVGIGPHPVPHTQVPSHFLLCLPFREWFELRTFTVLKSNFS